MDAWHTLWHPRKQTLSLTYSHIYTARIHSCKMCCYTSVKTCAYTHTHAPMHTHTHRVNCAYSWAYIQGVPFRKADFYCFPGVYSVCVCTDAHGHVYIRVHVHVWNRVSLRMCACIQLKSLVGIKKHSFKVWYVNKMCQDVWNPFSLYKQTYSLSAAN